jgi:Ca2+-binding RTX toxin-like protein
VLNGTAGDNLILGAGGNDLITGGDGNDRINPGHGADTVNGGNGLDVLDYSRSAFEADLADGVATNTGITANLQSGSVAGTGTVTTLSGDVNTTFSDIEGIIGSIFNDTLIGHSGADYLDGSGGNDTIYANGGADTIYGGGGSDRIIISSADFALIDGGGSVEYPTLYNVLELEVGFSLDLRTVSDAAVRHIQTVDLRAANSNTLTLNVDDVIAMTDDPGGSTAYFTANNPEHALIVRGFGGPLGDTLNLAASGTGTWVQAVQDPFINATDGGGGATFHGYDYVSGGQVLASVAVDATVQTNLNTP